MSDDEAVEETDVAADAGEAAGAVLAAVSGFVDVPAVVPDESPEDLGLALP